MQSPSPVSTNATDHLKQMLELVELLQSFTPETHVTISASGSGRL